MIRRIASYGVLIILVSTSGCGEEPVGSTWANTPPIIDGDSADWPMSHMTYVEKTRGVIGVANDDSMVYLLFRFRDQNAARKAMVGGATVWWSPSGTKDREAGIRFSPTMSIRDVMPGRPPEDSEPDDDSEGNSAAPAPQSPPGGFGDRQGSHREGPGWMPGQGFGRPVVPTPEEGTLHSDIRLVTAQDPAGISEFEALGLRAQSTYRKGTYAYELAIPLGAAGELGIGAADGKAFLSVVVGGVSDEDRDFVKQTSSSRQRPSQPPEGADDRSGGGPGDDGGIGATGGGRGGRGPGGGRRGMPNPMEDLLETIEASFTITLAHRTK
ncbi:hypothetical protein JXA88_08450 [Candidatus Fermentibacteria bacterium]|nr:hypothetical protein [Candidatus Fermentibacteria bacterium]